MLRITKWAVGILGIIAILIVSLIGFNQYLL